MIKKKAEVIAISSGKGGVGKTTLTVNLGIALSRQQQNMRSIKVCLFDADTNLANINILLKETPQYTLQHVLEGDKKLSEIMVHSNGISFVPGASGVTEFNELGRQAQINLLNAFRELESMYDFILVDTSAGIHDNVLSFIQSAQQSLVIITPEPTSLTDAFSLLRMLRQRAHRKRINVIVNHAISEQGARKIFKRFSAAVIKYIGYHPVYFGFVNHDEQVSVAVCAQVPINIYKPNARASQCFERLANNLAALVMQQKTDDPLTDQWQVKSLEAQALKRQTLQEMGGEGRPLLDVTISSSVINDELDTRLDANQQALKVVPQSMQKPIISEYISGVTSRGALLDSIRFASRVDANQ